MKIILVSICCWLLHFTLWGQTNTWFVHHAATGGNNGQSWADAYTDFQAALDAAQSGDAIWVAAGTYRPDTAFNRDRSFVLKSGVRMYGGFAGTETALSQRNLPGNPVILSGNIGSPVDSTDNSYTILYMAYPDTSTRIDGFIFQHGFARNDTNFIINTPVSSGGAVFILAQNGKALPVFANCTFRDNAARFNGGAIYVQGQGTQGSIPIFKNCAFINNSARIGGAIYLSGGNNDDRGIEFDHCRFEGNDADTQGGAIYYYNNFGNETLDFSGCVVTKNNCTSFGSFFNYLKTGSNPLSIQMDSCTVFSNGPDASMLMNVENWGQPFKTKFIISGSSIYDNHLFHPGNNMTFLMALNQVGSNYVDTIIISNNLFKNNISGFIIFYETAGFFVCRNNIIINNSGLSASGTNVEFSGNLLVNYSKAGAGMLQVGNSKCVVKNNVFVREMEYHTGLSTSIRNVSNGQNGTSDSLFIINNLFLNHDTGIFQYWNDLDTISFFNIITNNIFLKNNKIIEQLNKPNSNSGDNYAYFSHNLMDTLCDGLSDRVVCGPGNVWAHDALFVDTAAFDFHLLPCSPAINQGDNTLLQLLGILQDLEGNPRIAESIVDIGPYESPVFQLSAATDITPACANSPGGAISISPVNGCEPYTYQWLPPVGNGPLVSELPPGLYAVTVHDGSGRQLQQLLQVPAAATPQLSPLVQDLQCGSLIGGTATVAVSGGALPYTFAWSNLASDSLLAMLPVGLYHVTVTDGNGCQDTAQMTIASQGQLTLHVDGEAISCFGAADAMLSAAPVNGKTPFSYQWSQGAADSLITGLGPGQYRVTATDFYGCTATFSFTLTEPDLLQVDAMATPATTLQNADGSAAAMPVSGGTQPYSYAWSNAGIGQTITGLHPGIYTVTVTDAHGCSATATATVDFVSSTSEWSPVTMHIWPNPMQERLEFQATDLPSGNFRFSLRDAPGRLLLSANIRDGRAVLDVSALPAGVYTWELADSNQLVTRAGKVVK